LLKLAGAAQPKWVGKDTLRTFNNWRTKNMHCAFRLRHILAATAVTFACVGQAGAATITLPHSLDYFATSGPGPINPGVLVGFNPQPDPPFIGRTLVDLINPTEPMFFQPGSGAFTILFGLAGPGGSPFTFTLPTGGPTVRGTNATYSFMAMAGDGSVFQVGFDISGFTGGWAGFNPQPEPPGNYGSSFEGFSFNSAPSAFDPVLGVTMVEGILDINGDFIPDGGAKSFALVPEPATLAVLGFCLAGLLTVRRRQSP
jgi:PEP-CTERM motif